MPLWENEGIDKILNGPPILNEEDFVKQESLNKYQKSLILQPLTPILQTTTAKVTSVRHHSFDEESLLTPSGKSPEKKMFKFPSPSGIC